MEGKNIEEKFNVKISYSLENSEEKTENSLHKTYKIDKKRPIDADLRRG